MRNELSVLFVKIITLIIENVYTKIENHYL